MTIKNTEYLHIPIDYIEDDSYDSLRVKVPEYGRTIRRTPNRFRKAIHAQAN